MSMFPIASTTLNSATTSVVFSNIPQTFTHLQLRTFSRGNFNPGSNTSGSVYLRFNNDFTNNNYQNHLLRGDGATVSVAASLNVGIITFTSTVPLAQGLANVFGANICDILDYTNTNKFKSTKDVGGYDQNTSSANAAFATIQGGVWLSTAAINRIEIWTDGDHTANSRFDLYGLYTSNQTGA